MTVLASETNLSTPLCPLATSFPHTHRQMLQELKHADARTSQVRAAIDYMKRLQAGGIEFEAVIPRGKSMPEMGVVRGICHKQCFDDVQEQVHSSGPVHVFINMPGDISVAVSPRDLKRPPHQAGQVSVDSEGLLRVVWTRAERGQDGLVAPMDEEK